MHMPNGKIIKITSQNKMTVDLELQIATNAKTLPHPAQFKEWVSVALTNRIPNNTELTIRIVDEEEIISLNYNYRNKNYSTNVLSFPVNLDETNINYNILGDIVICAAVVELQAKQQNKELLSHWAHMVVHGTLHLLGYDHKNELEANEMESLETELMHKLGFSSPY